MNKMKLAMTAALIFFLILACATIGSGDDQQDSNPTDQQQDQTTANDNQEQDTQNSQENASKNNDEEKTNQDDNTAGDKPPTTDIQGNPALWETDFGQLLQAGELTVEEIQANSDYETFGQILTIQFTNPGTDEVIASLPCGLVFIPNDPEIQALMMVQPLEISLAAGETAEFSPFVVCIDVAAGAPMMDSGYTVGYLESGDLLAFAECVCGEEISLSLDSFDAVGVQFAAWTVATEGDLMGFAEEEGSSFEDFLEEMEAVGMGEMFTDMLSNLGGEWLERCGITVGEK